MKKVLFALGAFGFMAIAATAEAADAANEVGDGRQDVMADEGLLPGGFYYGLGLSIANVSTRNEYTYGSEMKYWAPAYTVTVDETMGGGGVAAYLAANPGGVSRGVGTGGGTLEIIDYPAEYFAHCPTGDDAGFTEDEVNGEKTRLGGSLVIGYGRKLPTNNLYLALEAGLDFGRNTTFSTIGAVSGKGCAYTCNVVRNGLTPSLALRIGYIACTTGILTYLKVGATHYKLKENYYEYSINTVADMANSENKISQVVPTLGIGLEKAFAPKLTGRLECEYQFGKSKVKDFGTYGSTKLSGKGDIVVRVMFCHNLKVGV